jgi:hypothetical protein
MKKFILFLFLASVIVQKGFAQNLTEDEFTDPTQQTEANADSAENTPQAIIEENIPVANEDDNLEAPQIDAFKQNQNEPANQGSVLLEKPIDLSLNYKQRRKRHGVLFSVTYEKFYPTDYYSQYRDVNIENIIGSDRIDLFGAELGYKLNFQLGSVAILANYAQGGIIGKVLNEDRTINLKRYGLAANFAFDNFFNEPWVVPYGQIGAHQFEVDEDDVTKTEAKSASTQIAFNYKFGILFQLNWIEKAIDPSTQVEGLRSSGLENTFLDIFAISHAASSKTYDPKAAASKGDPDLATELELGAALKMEF